MDKMPPRCESCKENPTTHHATYGPCDMWLCLKCWNEFCDKYKLDRMKDPDPD